MTQPSLPFSGTSTLGNFPSTLQDSLRTLHGPPGTLQHPPSTLQHPLSTLRDWTSTLQVIFVRHLRAKRYVVRVRDDGSVRVTIPRWGSKREAQAFADRERAWIAKELTRVERERARPREVIPPEVERDLRVRARKELPVRLGELAAAHYVTVARVSVRNQRRRWGSCSPRGHICLNWRLVAMPDWVRDYVLIHELMHLKRMDHSPAFWKLVAASAPRYQEARAWLRRYGRP